MICRRCYHEIPPGAGFCPFCGAPRGAGDLGTPAGPESSREPPAPSPSPWDERGRLGWIPAVGETLQRSLLHPTAFFRGLALHGGAGSAVLYAVLVGTVCAAVAMMWQHVMGAHISWMQGEHPLALAAGRAWIVGLFFLPVFLAAGTVVWAAVLHLSLLLLGGARSGFAATVKAVAYSHSAMVLNVVPLCGAPVSAVWYIVLQVIGLRELHRVSTARAFFAWLLPIFVLACLGALAASMALVSLTKLLEHLTSTRFEV